MKTLKLLIPILVIILTPILVGIIHHNSLQANKHAQRSIEYLISQPYTYNAKLVDIIDGDTVILQIEIWEDITIVKRIRLKNVNCPELKPKSGTPEERQLEKHKAELAKQFVINQLNDYALQFEYDRQSDNFGRAIGDILYDNKRLTEQLIISKHAVKKIY